MHIAAIRKFLANHPDVRAKNWTTSDINREVVKPETIGTNKPYINKYTDMKTEEGTPYVSEATIFISHAWRYKFAATVADVIEQHAKTDLDAYYWFDLFTNDQNGMVSKDFEWFCTTFRESIRSIGHVLLVLSPWNDPLPIRRAWCLFEIANTLKETDIQFTIYLPLSEVNGMSKAVTEESESLVNALANIQAEKAEAKMEEDRARIFEVIENTDGGFYRVNEQVKKGLREWYVAHLRGLLEGRSEEIEFVITVASIMLSFGFMSEARSQLDVCLSKIKKPAKPSNKLRQKVYYLAGQVNLADKLRDVALDYFQKSHEILERLCDKKDMRLAESYLYLGEAQLCQRGLTEVRGAEYYYNQAKEIILLSKGDSHIAMAGYHEGIAEICFKRDIKDEWLVNTRKVCELRIAHFGDHHPIIAKSYNKIGNCLAHMGKPQEGLEYYQKALKLNLAIFGELHETTASTYQFIGTANFFLSNLDLALEFFNKALDIALSVFGEKHTMVATIYVGMAKVYNEKGDCDKAAELKQKGYLITVNKHIESSESDQQEVRDILLRRAQKGK